MIKVLSEVKKAGVHTPAFLFQEGQVLKACG